MFFVGLSIFCVLALAVFFIADAKQRRTGQVIVGSVVQWQKSGIPCFGRVVIDYTIRGRHYSCFSSLIPNWKRHLFRPKSMRRYLLRKYPKTCKSEAFYIATAICSPSEI